MLIINEINKKKKIRKMNHLMIKHAYFIIATETFLDVSNSVHVYISLGYKHKNNCFFKTYIYIYIKEIIITNQAESDVLQT